MTILSVRIPDNLHAELVAMSARKTLATGHRTTVSDLIRAQIETAIQEADRG